MDREQNQSGPAGTYGCACVDDDARWCSAMRYQSICPDEACECLCHQWREEDDVGS